MQDEHLREDARQLLRVAYEREVAHGDVGLGVDLQAAAEERGLVQDSPHLVTLTDYMRVVGWIEEDTAARVRVGPPLGNPLYRITERGMEVLREVMG